MSQHTGNAGNLSGDRYAADRQRGKIAGCKTDCEPCLENVNDCGENSCRLAHCYDGIGCTGVTGAAASDIESARPGNKVGGVNAAKQVAQQGTQNNRQPNRHTSSLFVLHKTAE